jgi:hypothetical protein
MSKSARPSCCKRGYDCVVWGPQPIKKWTNKKATLAIHQGWVDSYVFGQGAVTNGTCVLANWPGLILTSSSKQRDNPTAKKKEEKPKGFIYRCFFNRYVFLLGLKMNQNRVCFQNFALFGALKAWIGPRNRLGTTWVFGPFLADTQPLGSLKRVLCPQKWSKITKKSKRVVFVFLTVDLIIARTYHCVTERARWELAKKKKSIAINLKIDWTWWIRVSHQSRG